MKKDYFEEFFGSPRIRKTIIDHLFSLETLCGLVTLVKDQDRGDLVFDLHGQINLVRAVCRGVAFQHYIAFPLGAVAVREAPCHLCDAQSVTVWHYSNHLTSLGYEKLLDCKKCPPQPVYAYASTR